MFYRLGPRAKGCYGMLFGLVSAWSGRCPETIRCVSPRVSGGLSYLGSPCRAEARLLVKVAQTAGWTQTLKDRMDTVFKLEMRGER